MEDRINVAELLKDCPQGMELDSSLFYILEFDSIDDEELTNFPIKCRAKCKDGGYMVYRFTKFGHYCDYEHSKCVIFPKGRTTWEGFVPPCKFKAGDVIHVKSVYEWIAIYKESDDDDLYKYVGISALGDRFVNDCNPLCHKGDIREIRYATEEEKQKLFQAIKDNGYKWNEETKTLEELIELKFRDGDIITCTNDVCTFVAIFKSYDGGDRFYRYASLILDSSRHLYLGLSWSDWSKPRLSTKEERDMLFSAIRCHGYVWNADEKKLEKLSKPKFDITTLNPFAKVLVRYDNVSKWCASFFSHIDEDLRSHRHMFITTSGSSYPKMIPYEGNEHLRGTANDCDEYYKTW